MNAIQQQREFDRIVQYLEVNFPLMPMAWCTDGKILIAFSLN